MIDFVISQQLQSKKLKSKRTPKRIPQPPKTFKKLVVLLYKINLVQDCFFAGYELLSVQNRETYSLSLITLLLLSAATFGLISLFLKIGSKLTIFSSLTGEVVSPKLAFGFMAIMPMLIIPVFNPSMLSQVVRHGIYASCSAVVVFCFSFESMSNKQILVNMLYLLIIGLVMGILFKGWLG